MQETSRWQKNEWEWKKVKLKMLHRISRRYLTKNEHINAHTQVCHLRFHLIKLKKKMLANTSCHLYPFLLNFSKQRQSERNDDNQLGILNRWRVMYFLSTDSQSRKGTLFLQFGRQWWIECKINCSMRQFTTVAAIRGW